MNEQIPHSASPFQAIRAIDYTIIFVRDMAAMRAFYGDILRFSLLRELSPGWIEYQIGGNILALSRPHRTAKDAPTPAGSASLQLAFKVAAPDVDRCADELVRHRRRSARTADRSVLWPSYAVFQGPRWKSAGGVCGHIADAAVGTRYQLHYFASVVQSRLPLTC